MTITHDQAEAALSYICEFDAGGPVGDIEKRHAETLRAYIAQNKTVEMVNISQEDAELALGWLSSYEDEWRVGDNDPKFIDDDAARMRIEAAILAVKST